MHDAFAIADTVAVEVGCTLCRAWPKDANFTSCAAMCGLMCCHRRMQASVMPSPCLHGADSCRVAALQEGEDSQEAFLASLASADLQDTAPASANN
jgi:hypothetical protein